jgi:hypothetical protein
MTRALFILLIAADVLVGQAPSRAGTYRIVVCKVGRCGFGDTAAIKTSGTLVLSDTQFVPRQFPDTARKWFEFGMDHPNACYVMTPPRRGSETFAGARRVGLTRWTARSPDRIDVFLYASPDAWHAFSGIVAGDTIRGRGSSWGAGAAEVKWLPDSVVAVRTGPADPTLCIDAAVVRFREMLARVRQERQSQPAWEGRALFSMYLNSKKRGDYSPNAASAGLWVSDEQKRWPMYEIAAFYLAPGALLHDWDVDTVPGSKPIEYRIRASFREDSTKRAPTVTMTLYATRENGDWKLANALPRHTRSWTRATVGPITYVYPTGYKYDARRANRAVRFTDSLATAFGVPRLAPIEYYLGSSLDEIYQILGLEYVRKFGPVGGLAQPVNRMLFSGIPSDGEEYRHELAHMMLLPLNGAGTAYFVSEGTATWLGGTTGMSFRDAVLALRAYIRGKPDVTLDAFLSRPFEWPKPSMYAAAGVMVAMVFDAGGTAAVKELFSRGGATPAQTHATVQRLLAKRSWADVEAEWRRRILSR